MKEKTLLCLIPSLGGGGAERQMLKLIELLNERSIVPSILTFYTDSYDYDNNLNYKNYNVSSKNRVIRIIKVFWRIFSIRPNVLLTYTKNAGFIGSVYAFFFRRCKVVISERNLSALPLTTTNRIKFKLFKYVYKIIPNSYSQQRLIEDYKPQVKNKIYTIINYTDTSFYTPTYRDKPEKISICTLARYCNQKNTLRYLKAIKLFNDRYPYLKVDFYWYGQNELIIDDAIHVTDYYKKCVELKNKLNLSNAYLNGYEKDVSFLYKKYDVICLPSLKEGFSNTLSEAICSGLPIIASDVSDNSVMVHDKENGFLFDPKDLNSIVTAIYNISTLSIEDFRKFQHNSRIIAENLFDKDRFISDYTKILFD